jgi:ABC-type transporter MlaC component
MPRRLTLALIIVATLAAPTFAVAEPLWPGSPTEAVRGHIEETIGIAVDRRLNAAARQEAARVAVARSFDFDELSRRALGEHWARMTATQRKGATAGVRAMVTGVYTSRMGRDLGERVGGMRERLHFIEESVSGSVASVTMSLSHANQDLPLQVALVRRGREWRIADLAWTACG